MSSRRPFFVVEGPNGAGKSSVAADLAAAVAGRVVRYPESFLRFRSEASLDALAPLPRLAYYLAGIVHLSDVVSQADSAVVCDRYFASPLAMMLAEDAMSPDELAALADPVLDRIAMPAMTVLVTADHETLLHRLGRRREARAGASLRQTVGSAEFAAAWIEELRRLVSDRGPVVEIDTSSKSPAEVARVAADAVLPLVPNR